MAALLTMRTLFASLFLATGLLTSCYAASSFLHSKELLQRSWLSMKLRGDEPHSKQHLSDLTYQSLLGLGRVWVEQWMENAVCEEGTHSHCDAFTSGLEFALHVFYSTSRWKSDSDEHARNRLSALGNGNRGKALKAALGGRTESSLTNLHRSSLSEGASSKQNG
eukprot:2625780-Amphidinium_carterae.1